MDLPTRRDKRSNRNSLHSASSGRRLMRPVAFYLHFDHLLMCVADERGVLLNNSGPDS